MRARVEKRSVLGCNKSKCYVDENFPIGWNQEDKDNSENVMLQTGYLIIKQDVQHYASVSYNPKLL